VPVIYGHTATRVGDAIICMGGYVSEFMLRALETHKHRIVNWHVSTQIYAFNTRTMHFYQLTGVHGPVRICAGRGLSFTLAAGNADTAKVSLCCAM
jgi:hypothetical protein